MTRSEIEAATFLLVAQCLNQLRQRVPQYQQIRINKIYYFSYIRLYQYILFAAVWHTRIFLGFLTLEIETDRLSRNVGKELPLHFFFFFHWRYSPLWALACRTILLYFSLSYTNSIHLLIPSTWRSISTFHLTLYTVLQELEDSKVINMLEY